MAAASLVVAAVMGFFVFPSGDKLVAADEDIALEPVEL
jgi:hypothetical protein